MRLGRAEVYALYDRLRDHAELRWRTSKDPEGWYCMDCGWLGGQQFAPTQKHLKAVFDSFLEEHGLKLIAEEDLREVYMAGYDAGYVAADNGKDSAPFVSWGGYNTRMEETDA